MRQSLDHRILLIRWQMDVSGHFCKRRIVFGAVLATEKAFVGGKVRLIRIGPLLRNSAIIDYGLNGERGRGAPAAASSTTRVGVGGTVQDELLRQNGQVTRCQRPIALNRFRATESPAATYKGGEIEIQHVILEGRARIESKGHLSLPRQEVSASYCTKISLPHLPWSFTVLITPSSRQSLCIGGTNPLASGRKCLSVFFSSYRRARSNPRYERRSSSV